MIFLQILPKIFSSKNDGVISVKALLIFARRPLGGSFVTWKEKYMYTCYQIDFQIYVLTASRNYSYDASIKLCNMK